MKKYLLILTAGVLLASCGDDEPVINDTVDPVDTAATDLVDVTEVQYFYQVPTPDELFAFIIDAGNDPQMDLLNSPENVDNYVTNGQQSLNFGIYSTDLAYASHYNQGKQTLDYFKVVNDLGNELDIAAAFNETMRDRIENNMDNVDSLLNISEDTYYSAYNYLEENEQGAELSLVVTGGWIESLYIVTQTTPFNAESPVITRIAEQRYSLENIRDFMGKYKDDATVASTLQSLDGLQSSFDEIEEQEVGNSGDAGDRPTLGGTKTKLVMTAEQFEALKGQVAEIRNSMTGSNS